MEELYNIAFKGELVRSFDLDTAKKNVGKLFKIDGAKLEALFSGKTVILKRNLNFEAANKYRVAIKKAGARVDLVPVTEPAQAAAKPAATSASENISSDSVKQVSMPPPSSQGKAVFGERPSAFATHGADDGNVGVDGTKSQIDPSDDIASEEGVTLAPVGASVLKESEREAAPVANIDVSGLSLKEGDGELLEASEKNRFEEAQIDLVGIDLAPAGVDLLKEGEKVSHTPKEVDLSGLELAEPGVRLGQPAPEPPPAPDVSGITLES